MEPYRSHACREGLEAKALGGKWGVVLCGLALYPTHKVSWQDSWEKLSLRPEFQQTWWNSLAVGYTYIYIYNYNIYIYMFAGFGSLAVLKRSKSGLWSQLAFPHLADGPRSRSKTELPPLSPPPPPPVTTAEVQVGDLIQDDPGYLFNGSLVCGFQSFLIYLDSYLLWGPDDPQ